MDVYLIFYSTTLHFCDELIKICHKSYYDEPTYYERFAGMNHPPMNHPIMNHPIL